MFARAVKEFRSTKHFGSMKHRTIGRTVCCICLALTCVVGSSLSTTGAAWAQAQSPTADGWTKVKEWSGGPGSQKTETFAPSGRPWRVSYKTTSGERMGILDIIIWSEDGQWMTGAIGLQGNDQGVTAGSILVDKGEKGYTLEIRSAGLNWQVVVEQKP